MVINDILSALGLSWLIYEFIKSFRPMFKNKIIQGILMLIECPRCIVFWTSIPFVGFYIAILMSFIVHQLSKLKWLKWLFE